jgi:hypothetical protein
MELELIEPLLFFDVHPQAPGLFAEALVKHLAVKE